MSKITYTKDDKVEKREGEFYKVSSCYTTPKDIAKETNEDWQYKAEHMVFWQLFSDVDELMNKPRRFFDHMLSLLEFMRDNDVRIDEGNHREYWLHLIKGAEMWLSAVNNGLYGCVEKLAEPVGYDWDEDHEHELYKHDDEKLESLLFELQDAVWCSKPDKGDNAFDDRQREEAKRRESIAMDNILQHFQQQHNEMGDCNRFCGICYRPSINKGGWWCPDHEYLSVYIPTLQADKLREHYDAKTT